ncbi:MAG: cytochrome P450 [Chloroflexota bacterium]
MAQHTPPLVSGSYPLLGHVIEFSRDQDNLVRRGKEEHGDLFSIKLLSKNVAIINKAEFNKFFYSQTDKKLNINNVYNMLEAAFGQVLFIASKDAYDNQRPLLQYIFSREKLAGYVQGMQYETQRWLDSLGDSGEMNVTAEMQQLAQHIAGNAFLGPDFRDELTPDFWEAYADLGKSLDPALPTHWPLPKFRKRDKAKEHIQNVFRPMIEKRRANPDDYDDLISQLLTVPQRDGTIMDDETIVSLYTGLIFAGHETTAGQAAWQLYEICRSPEISAKIQAEVNEKLPVGTQINGKVLRSMQQMYWTIDETTRMHPSAPLQMRIAEEDVTLGDYHIPEGWLIMTHYANAHFDERIWTNPQTFDPERWSPDRRESKDAFDIIGFGGGKHKCTGMGFAKHEMAIIAGLLMQQFEIEVLSNDVTTALGMGAARPTPIYVKYRKKHPSMQIPSTLPETAKI